MWIEFEFDLKSIKQSIIKCIERETGIIMQEIDMKCSKELPEDFTITVKYCTYE